MPAGESTFLEIDSQPRVWELTLQQMLAQWDELSAQIAGLGNHPFIVTGCGSTYYLSLTAAAVLRAAGLQAWALPASELVFYPQNTLPEGFLLLAISRSGTTSETLWAMDAYRRQNPGGKIIAISCVPETPMVRQADVVFLAPEAQERSVVQTRSFSTMALLVQGLAGMLTHDRNRLERMERLPGALKQLLDREAGRFKKIGEDLHIERLFFLGSGPLYGIADECMLKTKETSASWVEAYHPMEFRHGPMSCVDAHTLVVGLLSDSETDPEIQVLREMKKLGAQTLALCEKKEGHVWDGIDMVVELQSGLSEWERPALYLPLIHWLAFYRALAKGKNPDSPEKLTQVIRLDEPGSH